MKAELFACLEVKILRVTNRIRGGVPYGRTIGEPVELALSVYEVHEVELIGGIVVDKGGCEAGDVVDAGAVVDDPESLREWAWREKREARWITNPVREQCAAEEVLCCWRGRLRWKREGADLGAARAGISRGKIDVRG